MPVSLSARNAEPCCGFVAPTSPFRTLAGTWVVTDGTTIVDRGSLQIPPLGARVGRVSGPSLAFMSAWSFVESCVTWSVVRDALIRRVGVCLVLSVVVGGPPKKRPLAFLARRLACLVAVQGECWATNTASRCFHLHIPSRLLPPLEQYTIRLQTFGQTRPCSRSLTVVKGV